MRLTNGSFEDFERSKIKLKPGLEVFLDNDEGLSIEGMVDYSSKENIWVAKYDHEKLEDTSPI